MRGRSRLEGGVQLRKLLCGVESAFLHLRPLGRVSPLPARQVSPGPSTRALPLNLEVRAGVAPTAARVYIRELSVLRWLT